MVIYKNIISTCAVLISTMTLISCNQSTSQETDVTPANQTELTTGISNKSAPSVSLSKNNVSIFNGDSFNLDIMIEDVVTSEGGAVSINFDPELLNVIKVTIDNDSWDFVNRDGRINNAEGSISDIVFSSYKGITGNSKIATIEFKSMDKGMSEIILRESSINPFSSNGEKMTVSFVTTNVTAK